jgi:predicted NACHT family NTPase
MSDEIAPFAGWLDEFKGFLRDSYQKGLLFIPKITLRKTKEKTRWYKFTPQAIRRELARGLGDLYESALKISKNEELTITQRERWSRLSAYIAQTINVILNAYDEVAIENAINDLKEYVRQHVET